MRTDHNRTECDRLGYRNYANGDCQVLAAALQRITRWPVAVFTGAGSHVTVVTPGGQRLDIHGLRDPAVIADQWHADAAEIVGSIDDLGWLGCGWCICDLRAARRVLDAAGLLTPLLATIADDEIDQELPW